NVGAADNELHGVIALAANDAWAVGYSTSGTTKQTLILHWDGTAWQVVASPNRGTNHNYLNATAAVAPGDIWAAGTDPNSSLMRHWNGTAWSLTANPTINHDVATGITALAANDVWATGTSSIGGSYTLHWNGNAWTILPVDVPGTSVFSARAIAAT